MAETKALSFDEIRDRVDIVDVISAYVSLQPAGKNFKGLCPFHSEKTPSFFVSKERQIFNCFGCGEKGNVFHFVQKIKNVTFLDAVKNIADEYHLPVQITSKASTNPTNERLYLANERAMNYYHLALTNMQSGQPGMEYLTRRNVTLDLIQTFQIGYASDSSTQLYDILKDKFSDIDLLELGLIKKHADGSFYDSFRNRVMFPILNEAGRCVGFSGRTIIDHPTEAKYVNTPLTKLFIKGELLYFLSQAIPAIKRSQRVFLFEGYLDVMAAYRVGLNESIASMGTSLTPEQAKLIAKHTNQVVLCYDGDKAGFEAMNKAFKILEDQKLQVSLVLLPEGLDPDEYYKKYGKEKLYAALTQNQIDPWDFRYLYYKKRLNLSKPSEIERFKDQIFQLLITSASDTVSSYMLQKLAVDLNVSLEAIRSDFRHLQLARKINKEHDVKPTISPTKVIRHNVYSAEDRLLQYFIEQEPYRKQIQDQLPLQFCHDPLNIEILTTLLDIVDRTDELTVEKVAKQFPLRKEEVLARLDKGKLPFSADELRHLIFTVKKGNLERDVLRLREERSVYSAQDPEYVKYSNQIMEILSQMKSLIP